MRAVFIKNCGKLGSERVGWTVAVLSQDKMEESPGSTGQGAR